MAKHACLIENKIVKIVEIQEESEYQELAKDYPVVLDIEGVVPEPEEGWIFNGTNFEIPNIQDMDPEEAYRYQQKVQRQFGQQLLPDLIDKMGARNLQLARDLGSVDVAAIATQMASIKLLLETGALKTARGICLSILPAFPYHGDILQYGSDKILEFLSKNNFE